MHNSLPMLHGTVGAAWTSVDVCLYKITYSHYIFALLCIYAILVICALLLVFLSNTVTCGITTIDFHKFFMLVMPSYSHSVMQC